MNRTIKFRGKRIDDGQWVYGYLFKTPLTAENFQSDSFSSGIPKTCISNENGAVFEIDPKTVGEFAGFSDQNEKEIYEGDICEEIYEDGSHVYQVLWYKDRFIFQSEGISAQGVATLFTEMKIIGNIFENPEFFK